MNKQEGMKKLKEFQARSKEIEKKHYEKFLIVRNMKDSDESREKFDRFFRSRIDETRDLVEMILLQDLIEDMEEDLGVRKLIPLSPQQLKLGGVYTLVSKESEIPISTFVSGGHFKLVNIGHITVTELKVVSRQSHTRNEVTCDDELAFNGDLAYIREATKEELDLLLNLMEKEGKSLSVNRDKVIEMKVQQQMTDSLDGLEKFVQNLDVFGRFILKKPEPINVLTPELWRIKTK